MQEQMQQLQQQLEASQKISNPSSVPAQTPENSAGPKAVIPKQSRAKPTTAPRKMEPQAGKQRGLPAPVWHSFGSSMCKRKNLFSFQQHLHPPQSEELPKSPLFLLMN